MPVLKFKPMKERSPYEGAMDSLGGKTCLGQVVSVDSDSRTVRVKTLGNARHGTDDQDLQNVKMLHLAWNPDGSYGVAIPLVGSYYIVGFINSEPVLLGAYPLSNAFGGGGRDNQTDGLETGDFGYVTASGSRIIVRAGGTVEIESTKGCRTYWIPVEETIATVCQNHELDTAGGFVHWNVDKDSGQTLLQAKMFTDVGATTAVNLQIGKSDSGAVIDMAIGPTEQDTVEIAQKNFSLQVQPTGATTLNIGVGKVVITISSAGVVDITTTGDATFNVGGKAAITAAKIELNGGKGQVLTTMTDPVVDNITGAPTVGVPTVFAGK